VTAPYLFSYIIQTAGTYYVEVYGHQTRNTNGNDIATPYTLQVSASPNLVWPYTPPPGPARKRKR
jgi:hypothetical protein